MQTVVRILVLVQKQMTASMWSVKMNLLIVISIYIDQSMFSLSDWSIFCFKCNFMYFLRILRLYGISFIFTDMAIFTGREGKVQFALAAGA